MYMANCINVTMFLIIFCYLAIGFWSNLTTHHFPRGTISILPHFNSYSSHWLPKSVITEWGWVYLLEQKWSGNCGCGLPNYIHELDV